ncbi:hypothetical protein M422DRAFT_255636 [Sphaerobolus stellatus SS14]|uniref:Uncharacterized protein n=1 Tax=Sphaerobolus stellatus (strain SS14) TaxID=990650 RepID=A0A0C9UEN5_SPHS4|nr:hypothetical protein M422DRAFT_255636 [Sphaerobolus stellatus SS14]
MPSVPQDIVSGYLSITFESYAPLEAGQAITRNFIKDSNSSIDISTRMSSDGKFKSLALPSLETAVVVNIASNRDLKSLYDTFSRLSPRSKALIGDFHESSGSTCCPRFQDTHPWNRLRFRIQILKIHTFQNTWDFSLEEKNDIRVVLRAWICAYAIQSEAFQKKLQEVTYVTVDTTWISKAERLCLAELLRQSDVVRYSEEIEMLAEFNKIKTTKDGYIAIKNARYKT